MLERSYRITYEIEGGTVTVLTVLEGHQLLGGDEG